MAICTYNRADILRFSLESLSKQILDSHEYEIIVVDNNSEDETPQVASQYCRSIANLRYVCETQKGLSHARNRAWREARAPYVAFVDDDCKIPEHYLRLAKELIAQSSPAVFGGPCFAFYTTPKPRWYKDSYITHKPWAEPRVLVGDECMNIYGMNMFFQRDVLEEFGGFDPRFGMSGKKVAYGEETRLFEHIVQAKPELRFYYHPELFVYHLVRPDKMTMRWSAKAHFGWGRFAYHRKDYNQGTKVGAFQFLTSLFKLGMSLATACGRSIFRRNRKQYPFIQNYLCEVSFQPLVTLGTLFEQYSARRD